MRFTRFNGTLRALIGSAFQALGLAEIYTLNVFAPLVHPGHAAVYHWSGTAANLFVPSLFYIGVFWAITAILLWKASRPGRWRRVIWLGILLFSPAIGSNNWNLRAATPHPEVTVWLFDLGVAGVVLLTIFWRAGFTVYLDRVISFGSSVLFFFSIGAALLFAQLIWFGWEARSLNKPGTLVHRSLPSSETRHGPRIVWIVFDELSYLQVYERRYPGLELPAFDALGKGANIFTHAVPAGHFTERVLPSLMLGEPVDTVRGRADGLLRIHNRATNRWESFDQHQTVFQDALDAGYRTGVAGWYMPYCRILPEVLDQCTWSYRERSKGGMRPQGTLAENAVRPFADALRSAEDVVERSLRLKPGRHEGAVSTGASAHAEDYRGLMLAADRLLLDPSVGFVLLHLPIPHLEGIYNRRTAEIASGPSTYLDNLALADRALGHMRGVLEQTGQWDSTVLVVMGDHSWRTSLYEPDPAKWRTEEDKASHGGAFDDRPLYAVKLAGQHEAARMEGPYPAVDTRRMLDQMMTGKLKSSNELSAWVASPRP